MPTISGSAKAAAKPEAVQEGRICAARRCRRSHLAVHAQTDENNHFADMDKAGKNGKTLLQLCAEIGRVISIPRYGTITTRASMRTGAARCHSACGKSSTRWSNIAAPTRNWNSSAPPASSLIMSATLASRCTSRSSIMAVDLNDKAHAKVHSIYETTMIGRHGSDLITMIPLAPTNDVPAIVPHGKPTGRRRRDSCCCADATDGETAAAYDHR